MIKGNLTVSQNKCYLKLNCEEEEEGEEGEEKEEEREEEGVCIHICMWLCVYECSFSGRLEEGVRSPNA